MSEYPLAALHKKKQQIEFSKIGIVANSLIDLFINSSLEKLTNEMVLYGVAQGIVSNLFGHEAEASVREISPYLDLLDGEGKRIEHNQWFQKVPNFSTYDLLTKSRMSDEMYAIPMYKTDRNVHNDQKVYVIYGLEFLNDMRHRDVEFIEFWRGRGTKLITRYNIDRNQRPPFYKYTPTEDIIFPEHSEDGLYEFTPTKFVNRNNLIYHNNMLLFQTPIMYKPNDMMNIIFRYRKDMNRSHDEIKLKGFVVEPIGLNING